MCLSFHVIGGNLGGFRTLIVRDAGSRKGGRSDREKLVVEGKDDNYRYNSKNRQVAIIIFEGDCYHRGGITDG